MGPRIQHGRARLVLWPGLLLLGFSGVLGACGKDPSVDARAGEGAPVPWRASPRDPELAEVRAVLEKGRGDLALVLLERVQGFEAECLRARAEFLRGDSIAALACLDRARTMDPLDPELAATEIEILAVLERLPAASEKLAAAVAQAGPAPALLRAQGVLELRYSGHAKAALEALERARARDPELPFLAWPLAQAHLLVGRAVLASTPAEATAHARAARGLWPELGDALELEAEGLAGELRFEEALALYEELEALGRTYGQTPALLHQRCATRNLLEHDREGAIRHYLTARRLGMDDQGLGFGADLLAEEGRAAFERGIAAAEVGDWEASEQAFARALECAFEDLAAEDHQAVARFQRADYRGAAQAWERVLARAAGRRVELSDPVALNLAKAWRLSGESARARAVLSNLLDREPEGPWSEGARELLLMLEAEELADR